MIYKNRLFRSNTPMHLLNLPRDILFDIALLISYKEYPRLICTCRDLTNLFNNDLFWHRFCLQWSIPVLPNLRPTFLSRIWNLVSYTQMKHCKSFRIYLSTWTWSTLYSPYSYSKTQFQAVEALTPIKNCFNLRFIRQSRGSLYISLAKTNNVLESKYQIIIVSCYPYQGNDQNVIYGQPISVKGIVNFNTRSITYILTLQGYHSNPVIIEKKWNVSSSDSS